MPFVSLVRVEELERGLVGLAGSFVMVDVEEDLLKVLARGARCVSLSSGQHCQQMSFFIRPLFAYSW